MENWAIYCMCWDPMFFLFWREPSLAPPSVGHYMTNQKTMHYHIGINLHSLISWHSSSFFQIWFHWFLSFSTPPHPKCPAQLLLLQQQHLSRQALTAVYWIHFFAQSGSSSHAYKRYIHIHAIHMFVVFRISSVWVLRLSSKDFKKKTGPNY